MLVKALLTRSDSPVLHQLRVLTRDCDDEEEDCPETEDTFCSDITVRDIK